MKRYGRLIDVMDHKITQAEHQPFAEAKRNMQNKTLLDPREFYSYIMVISCNVLFS